MSTPTPRPPDYFAVDGALLRVSFPDDTSIVFERFVPETGGWEEESKPARFLTDGERISGVEEFLRTEAEMRARMRG